MNVNLPKISRIIILIGGIIQLITSVRMFLVKYPLFKIKIPEYAFVFIIAGIAWLIIGILLLYFAYLMKNKRKFKLATILSLIVSILGLNIVSFIGSIFGLVHVLKNKK